jgi:hypothetical protein
MSGNPSDFMITGAPILPQTWESCADQLFAVWGRCLVNLTGALACCMDMIEANQ